MFLSLFFMAVLVSGVPKPSAVPTIKDIVVVGNSRISAETILNRISTVPYTSYSPSAVKADLQKLHEMGFFEELQIETRDAGDGEVDVVFKVREYPFLHDYSIEGIDSKLQEQIREYLQKENLGLSPAAPYNPSAGNKTALAIRNYLRSRKYPIAEVQVSTRKRGDAVHVTYEVTTGERLEVGTVRFVGNESISDKELLRQMRYAKPTNFLARWGGAARYIPEELYSDLQQIAIYYKSRGYAAVSVGQPRVRVTAKKSKQRIEIEIPIVEGDRYRLSAVELDGHIKTGAGDVDKLIAAIKVPCDYDYLALESTRQKIVDSLGHYGYGLAQVRMEQIPDEADHTIKVVYRVDPGDAIAIGRITFVGNKRVPDKFLRRELRAQEGQVFDSVKLDKSVERLNKSNLLQPLERSDVELTFNERTNMLDITFKVKEKERQGIYATGGTGGIGGGYLGILYTAFNFLRMGETLSFQMDGGASRSNMVLNIVGTHFLGSPFTLALSVFNRYAGFNVANVVPGPESLVGVFNKRKRGAGLSGAYPITNHLEIGMGLNAQRETLSDASNPESVSGNAWRSELSPFVLYDRTKGLGAEKRGYALSYSQSWDGGLFLKSLDSMRNAVQFTHYAADPLTKGRNSFVFHLQGSWVRAQGGGPLFVDRRFFPGDESVRGFSRGSLSPWAVVPQGSGFAMQPAGADTVLGVSTEYRVPIRGPLSGVGFFDLGWTHLDPRDAAQLGTGSRLIERTNGVLRASLGGELRIDLPIIRQPARMIFSWNPLRLNTILSNPSSVFSLVEPKTTLRFALGTLY